MTIIARMLRPLCRDARGATMIEYGLIIALIALSIMAALTQMRTGITDNFNIINGALSKGS